VAFVPLFNLPCFLDGNYLSHDYNRYGGIYHDGGGLWNDSHNVHNHNGNNLTVETYPGMGRHKVPSIFVHGARNVTIVSSIAPNHLNSIACSFKDVFTSIIRCCCVGRRLR
jgi:hypothetical protein